MPNKSQTLEHFVQKITKIITVQKFEPKFEGIVGLCVVECNTSLDTLKRNREENYPQKIIHLDAART
jgi:tRNA(Ser,Leu) C12 N-acetylase TAN1